MARLSINLGNMVAPTVAPTITVAKKVEEWHNTKNPTSPPIIVPIAPSAPTTMLQKLNPATVMRSWLGKKWPTLIDAKLPIASYIVGLVESGYAPSDGPIEPWAALAAKGYFELQWTKDKGMSSQPPYSAKDIIGQMNNGPLNQYSALVVQSRGPDDINCRAAISFSMIYWPDVFMQVVKAMDGVESKDIPNRIEKIYNSVK